MLKVQEIRELIKLIDDSSIQEFTYEAEGASVTMKKDSANVSAKPVVQEAPDKNTEASQASIAEASEVSPQEDTKTTAAKTEKPASDYDYEITSPMVGTLYSAASPDSEPYVHIGSKVNKDTVVCIVEAMKLFNEIEAEVSGEIVEILAENGELVEYGQPLFRVKTK